VPPNGLWVSSNSAGPQSVSAIRLDLGDGESAPQLTLKVHSKSGRYPILMAACPTDGTWQPTAANAGTWASKPNDDCTTSAGGIVSTDGTSVAFDLSSLVKGTRLDVAFVPIEQPNTLPIPQPPVTTPPTTVPALPSPLPAVPTTLPSPVPAPPPGRRRASCGPTSTSPSKPSRPARCR
jgi:hypothetical protein